MCFNHFYIIFYNTNRVCVSGETLRHSPTVHTKEKHIREEIYNSLSAFILWCCPLLHNNPAHLMNMQTHCVSAQIEKAS